MNADITDATTPIGSMRQPTSQLDNQFVERKRQGPMISVDELMKVVNVIAEKHGNDAAMDLILKCL